MQIIDPHLHLFDLSKGHYHWLKESNPPYWQDKSIINHSFSEQQLTLSSPLTLAGFVHIEAGFDNEHPWREVAWLESHCHLPFRSVAAVDLALPPKKFIAQVQQIMRYKSVVGCRHILDEQANHLLSLPQVTENLAYLAQQQLSFDLQMPLSDKKSVALLTRLLSALPTLTIIINHSGCPPKVLSSNAGKYWQKGLEQLSQFSQCAIKCSGFELVNRNYTLDWQNKIIQQCLLLFGTQRVMLASNFPLCLFTQSYNKFWQEISTSAEILNLPQSDLFYNNATYWYKFSKS